MVRIEVFPLGPLQTNAYLLTNETTNEAVVIDPGMNPGSLLRRVESLKVAAILLTHTHFDHIGGLEALRTRKKCPVYVHPSEGTWLGDARKNGSLRWPDVTEPIVAQPAEYDLAEGQKLSLIGVELTILHTPGHSPGSVSFLYENHLFGGDVLFRNGVGRTDLSGGNIRDLEDSIRLKLFTLPPNTIVYPGHGPKTTIGYEQEHNPYVQ